MRNGIARKGLYGAFLAIVFALLLACASPAFAADRVYESYYSHGKAKNAQYSYHFYALNDVQTTIYNKPYSEQMLYYNHDMALYLKTDNPSADNFIVRCNNSGASIQLLTASNNQFSDIDLKADAKGNVCKVDGGYVYKFFAVEPGTYSFDIAEKNSDGQFSPVDHFELVVADYDKAQNEWVDSVIAKATTSNMNSFQKMDAVVNYLNTKCDFKYLTFDPDKYTYVWQASEPNLPFFKTERWDSLVSPTKLKLIADRIGGFTEVTNLYYEYDRGTDEWYALHATIDCAVGSEHKRYTVCPYSETGVVDAAKKIDFKNMNSFYKLQNIRAYHFDTDYGNSSSSSSSSNVSTVAQGTSDKPVVATGSWKKTNGKWWYSYSSASASSTGKPYPVNDWVKIGGKTYHFDMRGYMNTGWAQIGGNWYYFTSSGAMKTGWLKTGGKWYYLNANGKMATGWKSISNVWYYLKPGNGAMATGWLKDGSTWYYLKSSGAMATGWQKVSGKWYYLNATGAMQSNGLKSIGGKQYHFNASGAMSTGWKKIDGAWYCFASSGAAKQNTWLKSGGKWYYFASDHRMCTGLREVGGQTYYLNASGAMATGWKQIEGSWRYFAGSGAMQVNKWIGGKYWVDSKGIMATSTWVDGGKYYVDSNGEWVPNKSKAA